MHTLQVEPLLLRQVQQARQHVWVSIDPLGLADELNLRLRSRRLRLASTDPVFLGVQELLPIEPGEPLWEPVCEALRSVEEQDSDVYFVLKAGLGPEHPDELDDTAEGPGLQVGAAVGALRAAAAADDSEEELGTARMRTSRTCSSMHALTTAPPPPHRYCACEPRGPAQA